MSDHDGRPTGQHRFLVFTELFLPTKGGTAVWFDEVYRRLGGKGIHILTARIPGGDEYDRVHPNTIHRLNLARHPWLRPSSLPAYLRLFFHGLRVGLRCESEAVHAGRVLPEGLVAWSVARVIRRPVVIYAHGEEITTWRRSPRRLRAMRFAYRHADKLIANSEFTRDELVKLGVDPDRIAIIHPGVDIDRFHPNHETSDLRARIGLGDEHKLILSVGRLSRRKGFDQVIAALPRLVANGLDVHHVLIGIGEDRSYLEGKAREHGVVERVHFLGHVESVDLPRWYCAADVFAMPNRDIDGDTEGFGMVFVEAAACGTPSIAGIAGGTEGAVEDGVTGWRVDGTDLEAVARALNALLGDRSLCSKMGLSGAARARKYFSWNAVAERTVRLTEDVARELAGDIMRG
ncbi:MAG TPA: glycosyltransferase family 4 protein [Rhodocyclaceae bacterium]|nr:glycosyltransferase family 4 protein [Rhodocyclaceae bacterium]HRQ46752.1 glycosyltransferase family 4 protein [Rhodocyclaceae bacterium]